MIPCVFCAEWKEPRYFTGYASKVWSDEHRILLRDSKCFVIPGYGPQVYPYALVLPARHCTGMLASLDESEKAHVFAALDALLSSGLFGSHRLTVFEHGGVCGRAGSCVDHAHFHVVDSAIAVDDWFRVDRPDAVSCSWSVNEGPSGSSSYLFAGQYEGTGVLRGFLAGEDETESQYFRRLIARRLGHTAWDWHAGMNPEWMRLLAVEFWRRAIRPLTAEGDLEQ